MSDFMDGEAEKSSDLQQFVADSKMAVPGDEDDCIDLLLERWLPVWKRVISEFVSKVNSSVFQLAGLEGGVIKHISIVDAELCGTY